MFTKTEIVAALQMVAPGLAQAVDEHVSFLEAAMAGRSATIDKQRTVIDSLVGRINDLSAQIPAPPGEAVTVTRSEMVAQAYQSGQAALGDALTKEFAETDAVLAAKTAEIATLQAQVAPAVVTAPVGLTPAGA